MYLLIILFHIYILILFEIIYFKRYYSLSHVDEKIDIDINLSILQVYTFCLKSHTVVPKYHTHTQWIMRGEARIIREC